MKQEITINGFKFWIDSKNIIYSGSTEMVGVGLYSKHVTENERKQVLNQLSNGK
jgi:hypothetical protein